VTPFSTAQAISVQCDDEYQWSMWQKHSGSS